jgi:hypothetical protein
VEWWANTAHPPEYDTHIAQKPAALFAVRGCIPTTQN